MWEDTKEFAFSELTSSCDILFNNKKSIWFKPNLHRWIANKSTSYKQDSKL